MPASPPALPRGPHAADLHLRIGKRTRLHARVEIDSGGLLAIGALVSSILLSSAAIVAVAKRRKG